MRVIVIFLTILISLTPAFALNQADTDEKVNNLAAKYNDIVTNYRVPGIFLVKEFRREFGSTYYVEIHEDTGFFGRFFRRKVDSVFYKVIINPDATVMVETTQEIGLPSASISIKDFNELYSTYIDMDPFSLSKKEIIDIGKRETIRLAFKVSVNPKMLKLEVVKWVFSVLI